MEPLSMVELFSATSVAYVESEFLFSSDIKNYINNINYVSDSVHS